VEETIAEQKEITEKVRHRLPMPRLEHTFQEQDIIDFDGRIRRVLQQDTPVRYTVEPEIEGQAVEIVYEKGTLTVASTRGDGYVGELVTPNVKTILTVPLTLIQIPPEGGSPIPDLLEVRGVIYVETEAFEVLNRERVEKNLPPFKGPADAAADALSQPNLRVTAKKPLNMFCTGIGEMSGPELDTQYELMTTLQQWSLRVNRPHIKVCDGVGEVVEYCHRLKEMRSQFPYKIGGAVVNVNQRSLQARLGDISGSHGWAIAYKLW
jgi:DNA ligase (NAD+)